MIAAIGLVFLSLNGLSLVNIFDDGSSIILANIYNISWWNNWGEDNLFIDPYPTSNTNTDYQLIIKYSQPAFGALFIELGNIDRNWWGSGIVPAFPAPHGNFWNNAMGSEHDAHAISFTNPPSSTRTTIAPLGSTLGFGCDTAIGYPEKAHKGSVQQSSSMLFDTLKQDSCQYIAGQGYYYDKNMLWQKAYDTLKLFVERCPLYPAPSQAWRAFNIWVGMFRTLQYMILHCGLNIGNGLSQCCI